MFPYVWYLHSLLLLSYSPTMASQNPVIQYHKPPFLISTDPSLLSIAVTNAAFAHESMYWAQPLPEDQMALLLHSSQCFGLYKVTKTATSPPPAAPAMSEEEPQSQEGESKTEYEQVGLARFITDRVSR